jgi:hypothetical protein
MKGIHMTTKSERPDVYTWPVSELDTVFARMIVAISRISRTGRNRRIASPESTTMTKEKTVVLEHEHKFDHMELSEVCACGATWNDVDGIWGPANAR